MWWSKNLVEKILLGNAATYAKDVTALLDRIASEDKKLLFDVALKNADFLESVSNLNWSQQKILVESLKDEWEKIAVHLHVMQAAFNEGKDMSELNAEFVRLTQENKDLQEKILRNLEYAKKVEHSDLFRKLLLKQAKFAIAGKFNIIIEGLENIPLKGPAVVSPRHYDGDNDSWLFIHTMPRKFVILGAIDYLAAGVQEKIGSYIYKKAGILPIHRPGTQNRQIDVGDMNARMLAAFRSMTNYLQLGHLVVIPAESWPNKDSHFTSKVGEEIVVEQGAYRLVRMVSQKVKVPIIPIGVKYLQSAKPTIVMKCGKPMYATDDVNSFLQRFKDEIQRLSE